MRSRTFAIGRFVAALLPALLAGGTPSAVRTAPPEADLSPELPSEGRLLVLNKKDATLIVLGVPSYQTLATIAVGAEPHEVIATPDGRKAYTANVGDKSVSVVDLRTYKMLRTIHSPALDYPHGLGLTSDGRRLLLTSEGSRRLVLIDTGRDVILKSVTTNQEGSHMVAVLKGDRRAFVANRKSGSVSEVGVPDLKIARTLKVGAGPEGIATTPNGRWLLVALQGSDQVVILDSGTREPVARLSTGATPIRIAVSPNSFTALISDRASDDVTVIDLLARRVKTTVRVGRSPGGLVTNAAGTRAFVCNNGSNSVSVLSVPGYEVVQTIPVGAGPDGIAFVPDRPAPGKGTRPPRPATRSRP